MKLNHSVGKRGWNLSHSVESLMVKYNVLSYIVLDAVFSNKYIVTVSSACPILATDVFARWFAQVQLRECTEEHLRGLFIVR
jgi:hypothetical protein